jgi:hypothetical protein
MPLTAAGSGRASIAREREGSSLRKTVTTQSAKLVGLTRRLVVSIVVVSGFSWAPNAPVAPGKLTSPHDVSNVIVIALKRSLVMNVVA